MYFSRSRRELSNEYLLPKFGFDAADNEPCKVCPLSAYRSPRYDYSYGDGAYLYVNHSCSVPYGNERYIKPSQDDLFIPTYYQETWHEEIAVSSPNGPDDCGAVCAAVNVPEF